VAAQLVASKVVLSSIKLVGSSVGWLVNYSFLTSVTYGLFRGFVFRHYTTEFLFGAYLLQITRKV
jgi:hypothetical protein